MKFRKPGKKISQRTIQELEAKLGFEFPEPVKRHYRVTNGGIPELYVFTNDEADTTVSEFLPLSSDADLGSALATYDRLVSELKLTPRRFFPFAVDGGGDYFFVDCRSEEGNVYYYRGDSARADKLVDLKLGFDEFLNTLASE